MGLEYDKKFIEKELRYKYLNYNSIISLVKTGENIAFENTPLIPITPNVQATQWKPLAKHCSYTMSGDNVYTGTLIVDTLIQIYSATGLPTGLTKANINSDPDYIAPALNPISCPTYQTEWVPDEATADCIEVTVYENVYKTQDFAKQCPSGQTGTTVPYSVVAGKYTSTISQLDADNKAQAEINANGQTNANSVGVCTMNPNYVYFDFNQTAIDATGILGTIAQKRTRSDSSIETLNSIAIDPDWATVSGYNMYAFTPFATTRFLEINITSNTLTQNLLITLKKVNGDVLSAVTIPAGTTGLYKIFEGAESNEPIIQAYLELVDPAPVVYESKWIGSDPYCITEDIVINEFDYLVARYLWETGSGQDLDIQVQFENTGESIDNTYVGFGGVNPTVPASTTPETNAYLWWGLDTTATSGIEGVLVGLKKFKDDFPFSPNIIEVGLYAVWYNSVGTGNFTLEVATYKGGTMSKVGTNIINTGGVQVSLDTRALNTTIHNNLHTPASSYKIGTLKYNKTTDTAILELA